MSWFESGLAWVLGLFSDHPIVVDGVPPATTETLYMVFASLLLTVLGGVPLGIYLWNSGPTGLRPQRLAHQLVGFIVNVVRSLPFVILMVALLPFTEVLVGRAIGTTAAIVPLTIGAIPFLARLVEAALREVSAGKIEASVVCGASRSQTVTKTLLPEALPGLIAATTTTAIAIIAYSAMAGVVGAGGLGYLADAYGYKRFETEVLVATVILLVILVQAVQLLGDLGARVTDHRAAGSNRRNRRLRRSGGRQRDDVTAHATGAA